MTAEAVINSPAGTKWIEAGRKARTKEHRLKWLVGIWMAVVFYWPVMNVAGVDFRADYPFALIMAVWLALQRWGRATRIMLFILLVYSILLLIGTINGIRLGYPFNIAAFTGFLRFFLIAAVWAELLRKIQPGFVIRLIPVLALPAAIFALLQISVPDFVSNVTIEWYSSAAQTPTLRLFGEGGSYARAVSVFESPIYLGFACLLFILLSYASVESSKNYKNSFLFLLFIAVYILAGLASGSSTFLLGVCISAAIICFRALVIKANIRKWVSALISGAAGGLFFIYYWHVIASQAAKSQFHYQMNKILSGDVFASRFGSQGNLWETISHWPEYIITGLGAVNPPYFTGDNLYLGQLSTIGLPGLSLLLLIFMVALFNTIRRWSDPSIYSVTGSLLIILAAGMATPTVIKPRLTEIVAFLITVGLFFPKYPKAAFQRKQGLF